MASDATALPARPQFKPAKSRASIAHLPSLNNTASTLSLSSESKENPATGATSSVDAGKRKKRAQSLGGEALEEARKRLRDGKGEGGLTLAAGLELSPGKIERRNAQPRRSILKQRPSLHSSDSLQGHHTISFPPPAPTTNAARVAAWSEAHAQTTDLSALSAFSAGGAGKKGRRSSLKPPAAAESYDNSDASSSDQDEEEDPNGSLDMDMTRFETTAAYDTDGRRYSVSHTRRVSFAPSAAVRMYTPDKPTADAQALAAAREAALAAALALQQIPSSSASASGSDEEELVDEGYEESEPSMEIAGDEPTLAFARHFAGTQIPVSVLEEEEDADEPPTAATTAAGAQLQLFGTSAPTPGHPKPRFSEVARREDEDDEDVMRQLGFARGGKPRPSRVGGVAFVEEEEGEEGESSMEQEGDGEGGEDETGAMEMTVAIGGIVGTSAAAEDEQDDDDDDSSSESGDSEAEVSMQLTSGDRTMDMTFATDIGAASERDEDEEMQDESAEVQDEEDATAAMVEATAYGSILPPQPPAPAPTTAAPPPRTTLFAPRPSIARSPSPFASITRATSAPPASPPKSPFRHRSPPKSPGRALSVPLGDAAIRSTTPTKSPFRQSIRERRMSSVSPGPPTRSPRRIISATASPAPQPHARRPVSPAKSAYPPPSSLVAKSIPPQSPGITGRSRSRSRSRSASPVKQQQPNTPGRTVFQPRTLAPPMSAGRSPGGSLSLRALLSQPAQAASNARVDELRAAEGAGTDDDLNLTGSSYDASFSSSAATAEEAAARLPDSLDAFLVATGTHFADDEFFEVVNSESTAAKRRKSMAATARTDEDEDDETKQMGGAKAVEPTFADMTVAAAVKSLFHQLYKSEQGGLLEGINQARQMLEDSEQRLRSGVVPQVFKDWANATDEAKAIMKTQFGQIKLNYLLSNKLEWKTRRIQNYDQVVDIMAQNLQFIQQDRAVLTEVQSQFEGVIPSLEARHAALLADLTAERSLDAELSLMSPEDVEMRENMLADSEEQEEQLNGNPDKGIPGRRPELDRIEQHLRSYRETFEKYSTEEQHLQAEIADLEERRRDKRTKTDLVRLQAEFEALQHLQGWRLEQFSTQHLALRHCDEFLVGFELIPGTLDVVAAIFEPLQLPRKAQSALSAQVTAFVLSKVNEEVQRVLADGREPKDARALLRYIASRACIIRHIRREVTLASLRYPTSFRLVSHNGSQDDAVLEIDIDVFCAQSRQAFDVVVPLTAAEVLEAKAPEDWAKGISASVRARFGTDINALALAQTVNERLEGGDGRGALVEAVVLAEEECDQVAA
ncbi:Proteophosphoglycan ppg4 [Rhodotorula toruloides ATCC 204091]|uniref:Proteophosphoglycan ppg4 n=1 Tax=Rhodotorula toruloides TaxID=5286 RepID=A0A0K3C8R8_RHOTO|nr:Proteophosphoglycan ppg4 [Rhodotorula toruloides ATCC 204091]KAK4335541.1 Proteophosphoglycan ppg4 [Rhodotorula toruloides]PRQ78129.1 Proteophosphoglycan ppg4 [Rhodotorula toruloides]